jgi:hypothetical protein
MKALERTELPICSRARLRPPPPTFLDELLAKFNEAAPRTCIRENQPEFLQPAFLSRCHTTRPDARTYRLTFYEIVSMAHHDPRSPSRLSAQSLGPLTLHGPRYHRAHDKAIIHAPSSGHIIQSHTSTLNYPRSTRRSWTVRTLGVDGALGRCWRPKWAARRGEVVVVAVRRRIEANYCCSGGGGASGAESGCQSFVSGLTWNLRCAWPVEFERGWTS